MLHGESKSILRTFGMYELDIVSNKLEAPCCGVCVASLLDHQDTVDHVNDDILKSTFSDELFATRNCLRLVSGLCLEFVECDVILLVVCGRVLDLVEYLGYSCR